MRFNAFSRVRLITYVLCLAIVVIHVGVIGDVYYDDAYIFLVYAKNLTSGEGLCFNEGQPSFGISNPLWLFLLVGAHKLLPISLVHVCLLLNILFLLATALVWERIVLLITKRKGLALVVAALYLLFPGAHRTVLSGMDTQFHTFLVSFLFYIGFRHSFNKPVLLGVLGGLVVLSRVDAIFSFLALFAFLMLRRSDTSRRPTSILLVLALSAALVLPYLLYLKFTFGLWTPPTRIGKLMGLFSILYPEYDYVTWSGMGLVSQLVFATKNFLHCFLSLKFQRTHSLLGMAAIACLLVSCVRKRQIPTLFLVMYVSVAVTFLLYAFKFPIIQYRYFNPLTPLNLAFIITTVAQVLPKSLLELLAKRKTILVGISLLALAAYAPVYHKTIKTSQRWDLIGGVERDTGRWLAKNSAPTAKVAVEPMGAIKYYSGRTIIDLGGLTDPTLWKYLGHGFKDTASVLRYLELTKPDYLVDWMEKPGPGRTVKAYPQRFESVANIKPRNALRGSPPHTGMEVYKFLKKE